MRRLEGLVRVRGHRRVDTCVIYLPREIARRLGIERGDPLDIRIEGGEMVVSRADKARWRLFPSGDFTLPKKLREELGIESGDELLLYVDYEEKKIYLRKR